MRKATLRCIAVLSLLTACGGGGGGGSPAAQAPTPVRPSTIEGTLDNAVTRGVDGVLLSVVRGDGEAENFSAGESNRASNEPMSPDAVFKMASVSKLYIAVAVVQLVQSGQLALEDSIAEHLPELADRIENSESINLKLLLQHRSGVPDFDSQFGFSWRDPHTDVLQVLEYALDLPADFPPNAQYEYSNTNYLLLGLIMDRVLGYSHHIHIQDFILGPLGLNETWHLLEEADVSRLTRGYWDGSDTTDQDYVVPGGSMLATGEDIARFLHALATGQLLEPEAQSIYEEVYWLEHSGWLPGYQTIARYESLLDATLVLHINTTGGGSEQILSETYDRVFSLLR